jgi:hypothetical protein
MRPDDLPRTASIMQLFSPHHTSPASKRGQQPGCTCCERPTRRTDSDGVVRQAPVAIVARRGGDGGKGAQHRERTSGSVPSSARLGRRTPAAGDFAISGIGDDKAPRRGDETTLRCASVRGEGERCHDVARAGAVTCGGGVCFFLRVFTPLCQISLTHVRRNPGTKIMVQQAH